MFGRIAEIDMRAVRFRMLILLSCTSIILCFDYNRLDVRRAP